MANKTYDIIFIGGGLSSLMFLNKYLQNNKNQKILILEKNKTIRNDQTLCLWSGPGIIDVEKIFSLKAKKKWKKIEVIDNKNFVFNEINPYEYKAFDANKTLKKLKSNCKGITYKSNIQVKRILHEKLYFIETSSGEIFQSKFIFDSRPPKDSKLFKHPEILYQAFVGSEIIVKKDTFDDSKVTLMDFKKNNKDIIFTYILPFTKKRALIETTFFTKNVDLKLVNKIHKSYLKKFNKNIIIRKEKAILPMNIIINKKNNTGIKIGIGAGMIRPATGYSMQRIANWLHELHFKKVTYSTEKDYFYKGPWFLNWLDSIFLRVCFYNPKIGPTLFIKLFQKTNIFSIIRFMSDKPTILDLIKIILALPKRAMIQGLFSKYE